MHKKIKYFFALALLVSILVFVGCYYTKWDHKIIDSNDLGKMSLDEKIGQLLIVGYASESSNYSTISMIKKYHIGGVNLAAPIGGRDEVKKITSNLQEASRIPLFIGTDQEGGPITRYTFLSELTPELEIKNTMEAEEIAFRRAAELKDLGVNMDFSPVVDYVSNQKSYLYGRTFGATPSKTGELASAMIAGYEKGGIIPVPKHFPGYGNVTLDPHKNGSLLSISLSELEANLVSFKKILADNNTKAMMTAHVVIPVVDSKPATLSYKFITEILRNELGFNGVVITDDIEMVSVGMSVEETSLEAIKAGDDMIIDTPNPEKAVAIFNRLKQAVLNKEVPESRIDQSVARILHLKSTLSRTQ
jgi:beta-N-acetylhexosaminidase